MSWFGFNTNILPPQEIRPGVFALCAGSKEYAAALKSWRWAQPRGYFVTWRTVTSKPHLYRGGK